jgi:hypothetical protein
MPIRSRIKSEKAERDFLIYAQAVLRRDTPEEVLAHLATLEVPPPYDVRVKVVYSKTAPRAVFDRYVSRGIGIVPTGNKAPSYLYKTGDSSRSSRVPFFVMPFSELSDNVAAVISICRSGQWQSLRRAMKSMYPSLVPILLSQSELFRAAKSLKQLTGHDVHVRAISAKERIQGTISRHRRSVRYWTDEQLDEALAKVQDQQQVVTSLDVEFFPRIEEHTHVVPSAIGKIKKNGELEVSGSFKIAFDAIAVPIARAGLQKLHFFSGRGLREAEYAALPLAITFDRAVFDDLPTVRAFVKTLTKYPKSMHAVAHGNPYAHLNMTDLLDGSSFDIWAVPPDRIALIPGLKASEAAFERLVTHIFETFREGKIATYDRDARPLEATF